jgi:hypothetical protein
MDEICVLQFACFKESWLGKFEQEDIEFSARRRRGFAIARLQAKRLTLSDRTGRRLNRPTW